MALGADKPTDIIACVDPGHGGTGFAFWERKDWLKLTSKPVAPTQTGYLSACSVKDWRERMLWLSEGFASQLRHYKVKEVVIEEPTYWETSKGRTAARGGSLEKLLLLAGAFIGCSYAQGCLVRMYKPHEWKGQLSKAQMMRRLRKMLPDLELPERNDNEHVWDAIGLGIGAFGWFNKKPSKPGSVKIKARVRRR